MDGDSYHDFGIKQEIMNKTRNCNQQSKWGPKGGVIRASHVVSGINK